MRLSETLYRFGLIVLFTFIDVFIIFSAGVSYKTYVDYWFALSERSSTVLTIVMILATLFYVRFNHKVRDYITSPPTSED